MKQNVFMLNAEAPKELNIYSVIYPVRNIFMVHTSLNKKSIPLKTIKTEQKTR